MKRTAPRSPAMRPATKQRLRLWLRLLRTTRLVEAELRERLRARFDTTLPRFDVMAALYRAEKGLKMSEISRLLLVSNGNITGIVERLVAEGTVVRVSVAGDRRATLVRLTEKGREEFAVMAAEHAAWIGELFAVLPEEEVAEMIGMFDRFPRKERTP
jgi:DNA-binding MarR family transcriptional regulator